VGLIITCRHRKLINKAKKKLKKKDTRTNRTERMTFCYKELTCNK
jgi:hypothetical protein